MRLISISVDNWFDCYLISYNDRANKLRVCYCDCQRWLLPSYYDCYTVPNQTSNYYECLYHETISVKCLKEESISQTLTVNIISVNYTLIRCVWSGYSSVRIVRTTHRPGGRFFFSSSSSFFLHPDKQITILQTIVISRLYRRYVYN